MALNEHIYQNIPGWCAFGELYQAMVQKAPREAQFVEVGSWLGRSAALMAVEILNSGKAINFVCIDPWEDGGPDLRDTPFYKDLTKPVYDTFIENIRPVRHVVTPLRLTSLEGATKFADGEIDFLMLDGDHSYEAVKADIAAWLPKMKKGGVMSGDDYLWPGVKKAADAAFGSKLKTVIKHQPPRSREFPQGNYKLSAAYWWVQV